MMKKLNALLVLALLVISAVPAVFAQETAEDTTETEVESDAEVTTDTRVNARDRMQAAREKMQQTREKIADTRANALQARADFAEARAKIAGGRGTPAEKQDFLLAATDKVLELLNSLREKVEASDVDDKDAKLAEIDAAIEAMVSAQATVDALDPETATREEIRAAAAELRDAWQEAQQVLRKGVGHVVNKRIGNVVERMESLSDKLDRMLENLEGRGFDVSVAADLKVDFDAELASANGNWERAKELFDAGSVQEANAAMRAAHQDLKEAHRILKEIVKSIRASTSGSALEDAEDEADDDAESEESDEAESEEAEDAADDESESNEEDEEESDEDDSDDVNVTVEVDANVGVTV